MNATAEQKKTINGLIDRWSEVRRGGPVSGPDRDGIFRSYTNTQEEAAGLIGRLMEQIRWAENALSPVTVKTLKALISNLPDDMIVILQKDSEGNGYSPLHHVDPDAFYVPENMRSGEAYSRTYSAVDCCMEEAEHAALMNGPRCLVLAPVN